MQQPRRPAGHFAGILFFHDDIDASKWPYRLPSPAGVRMAVYMESLESVLAARAAASGVEIGRRLCVDGFDQSDEDVTIRAGGGTFRGRWPVGCDGGVSTVRKLGGIEFARTDPEFTGYSVEVELADPDKLEPGQHYTPAGSAFKYSGLAGRFVAEQRRSTRRASTESHVAAPCDRRCVPGVGGSFIVDGLATGRGQRKEHQQHKATPKKGPHAALSPVIQLRYSTL
jgi:2-polyprenyl-6-methoxyphenol hydroxylase-like FAD-dependent oxidoreductase